MNNLATVQPAQTDTDLMQQAGQYLLGEQDFSSFRAMQCQSHSPFRNVHHLQIERRGNYIVLDIKANAFLHHMVRNITGSLLEVGMQNRPPEWIGELLAAKNIADLVTWSDGLYQPPAKFRSW